MYYETNLARANSYYKVTKAFEVFERTGFEASNYWYGSSNILTPTYRRLTLKRGNIVMNLAGGIFVADRAGKVCRPITLRKDDKSPFEKRYLPDRHDWPLDKLKLTAAVAYVHAEEKKS